SGPLLDRIDIHVEVPAVKYQELSSDRTGEPSSKVRERVLRARAIQADRFKDEKGMYKNADMSSKALRKHCKLDEQSRELLKMAVTRLGFSARAYDRIIKLGRTIADLDGAGEIRSEHISEAIQYRSLDRQYWK
ncbi:MAG: magnesium chelatase, partial [Bacteroidota bacterium]